MHNSLKLSRIWWGAGWSILLLILYLSLMPSPPQMGEISDKWQHAFAYALMMSWFSQLVRRRWLAAIGLVVMGVGVEFVQGWSGLRYYEELDMVANASGVFIGWLMFIAGVHYLRWFENMVR